MIRFTPLLFVLAFALSCKRDQPPPPPATNNTTAATNNVTAATTAGETQTIAAPDRSWTPPALPLDLSLVEKGMPPDGFEGFELKRSGRHGPNGVAARYVKGSIVIDMTISRQPVESIEQVISVVDKTLTSTGFAKLGEHQLQLDARQIPILQLERTRTKSRITIGGWMDGGYVYLIHMAHDETTPDAPRHFNAFANKLGTVRPPEAPAAEAPAADDESFKKD